MFAALSMSMKLEKSMSDAVATWLSTPPSASHRRCARRHAGRAAVERRARSLSHVHDVIEVEPERRCRRPGRALTSREREVDGGRAVVRRIVHRRWRRGAHVVARVGDRSVRDDDVGAGFRRRRVDLVDALDARDELTGEHRRAESERDDGEPAPHRVTIGRSSRGPTPSAPTSPARAPLAARSRAEHEVRADE